ncbi:MAG: type I polyketide synthase [Cyanobacteria bacterium J06635_15]
MQSTEKKDYRTLMSQALLELKELQGKLAALEAAKTEPIAVVGLGCRFPSGADHPDAFWTMLREGRDGITEVPRDRWNVDTFYHPNPDAPGKIASRYGGFLDRPLDLFDAEFFGITPREAASLDPQQRLLLEVSWEALEHAGIAPEQLSGSPTGVFIGICSNDYSQKLLNRDVTAIDAYMATGNCHSVAAGRLSYALGLQGPSLAVDTACSSSLVAVHLAIQHLRSGECNLALVGGVNYLLSPEFSINFSRAHMLATDGRCKTFDTAADGYVRAEGCGVVCLKRLSDAKAAGDRIFAVIRGSAINQDGASSGLTVPNGPAQQTVIHQALAQAGLSPHQVGYVEAHGTGTKLGDPIEIGALAAVFGPERSPKQPLIVGSLKTNIGHLEGAAGLAGLIKVVLALQHGEIPPHLHFNQPTPHVSWDDLPLAVPTQVMPWPAIEARRIAGLSSFGFSGTNAHIVLEAPPDYPAPVPNPSETGQFERPLHLLTLSAKTAAALEALVNHHAQHWQQCPNANIADVCFSANTGRSHFDHRLSLIVASAEQLQEQLAAQVPGQVIVGSHQTHVTTSESPQIAFLFTGQGAQFVGMGRSLYETQPIFRQALDCCNEILRAHLDQSLLSVLYPTNPEHESLINQTAYTQPALFAVEYALAQLWQAWGIRPSVVVGHSIGEYVAAHQAGVFNLADGLKLIAARGRLMQALPQDGAMVVVASDEAQVSQVIRPYGADVAIAAINGPKNIVMSGRCQAIEAITAQFNDRGIKTKKLQVSHAFHSPLMVPMLDEFRQVAAGIKFTPPQVQLISTVTGKIAPAAIATPDYWIDHVCQPVRFAAAMATLQQQNCNVFLEIGPRPILLGMGQTCLPEQMVNQVQWLPSLRTGQADWSVLLQSLGKLYGVGAKIDWQGFDRGYCRHRVPLPTYPFQRQRHWVAEQPPSEASQFGASQADANDIDTIAGAQHDTKRGNAPEHPLLGRPLLTAAHRPEEHLWWSILDSKQLPYLREHRLWGSAVLFLGAYVEMALAAAKAALGTTKNYQLSNLQLHTPLFLSEGDQCAVQVVLTAQQDAPSTFQVYSQAANPREAHQPWVLHASAHVHHA